MRTKIVLAAIAAASLSTGAGAQTFTFVPGGSAPATGYVLLDNFNNPANDGAVTGTGFQFKVPPSDSNGAVPANTDGSRYLSVLGGGDALYSVAGLAPRSIQFAWGSTDTYNRLTVNTFNSGSFVYMPGMLAFADPTDGNQFLPSSNGLFTVKFGDDRISSVAFASGANSFELDNLSIAGAVPEPATWALMILGFGATGAAMRRRRAPVLATA